MAFKLADVNEWQSGHSCTPTALAALSGKTPQEIHELISKIARKKGRIIGAAMQNNYIIPDWLEAIRQLGGKTVKIQDARSDPFLNRTPIVEWMSRHHSGAPELIICESSNAVGHVFATQEGEWVDAHTKGKRVKFRDVPDDFGNLRVKLTYLVQ
jgi:hypothetical protein